MEYLCTWYTVAYWVLKVNTRPFFTGTRALVHRSKVWATAKIPLAVWQPATIAFLYVCMSSPLSVQKKRKKNARSQVSFVGTSNGNLRSTNALLLCICHDTAIVTRKSVMR